MHVCDVFPTEVLSLGNSSKIRQKTEVVPHSTASHQILIFFVLRNQHTIQEAEEEPQPLFGSSSAEPSPIVSSSNEVPNLPKTATYCGDGVRIFPDSVVSPRL
ncbi:hypothetical protein Tco_1513179 [Tanacetum coccineum]